MYIGTKCKNENKLRLSPSPKMSDEMKSLFLSCIQSDPKDRPTFIDIQEKLFIILNNITNNSIFS